MLSMFIRLYQKTTKQTPNVILSLQNKSKLSIKLDKRTDIATKILNRIWVTIIIFRMEYANLYQTVANQFACFAHNEVIKNGIALAGHLGRTGKKSVRSDKLKP